MFYNCLLTVKVASSRLKNKCSLTFKKFNFIEHSIKKCLNFNLKLIVCNTFLKKDNLICSIAKKYSVKFFRGFSNNKIKRYYDSVCYFNLNNFQFFKNLKM
jgi:spore coat polysaccharide biosynthesis protein SpsF (cytidylyltransferase family)